MPPPDMIANRYRVLSHLGQGAMGLVMHVEDTSLAQEMALKVISTRSDASPGRSGGGFAGGEVPADKTLLQFKQEFRLMTQLRHPNCCAVYDYGVTAEGAPYFTMEVVPGRGLDEVGVLSEAEFRPLFAQLLVALGYVHGLGYVHRDLKSANVRVTPDGVLKLMDYGLMDFAGRSGAPINGTPGYLAPEVIRRGAIDQRTDLYAAGVLAYELLTGRLPFAVDELGTQATGDAKPLGTSASGPPGAGRDVMAVLRAHINERPLAPRQLNPAVPADLERIVLRLMAKEPIERFRSAAEVLEALGVEGAFVGGNLLASPLMGREREMAALAASLQALLRHQGQAYYVVGDSGVGKSRLLEEFRFTVQLEAVPYAMGGLREQGNAPYAPFVAALKMLLPAMVAHVPAELARHAAVLVKLLPNLGALAGLGEVVPAPDMDPPSKEKLRLQSTMATLLAALAVARPFVLALEDWQWADPLSLEFLTYLVRNTRDVPLFLLVTGRPGDTPPVPAELVPLPIAPLAGAALTRMLSAMLGTEVENPYFVRGVAEFTEGNPFYVQELLEHLVQGGVLQAEHGRWQTEIELTADQLPRNLKGLLMRKITFLSPQAQELARVCAVVGTTVTLELLAAVSEQPHEVLFTGVEMLLHHRVLVVAGDGDAMAFAQDQLQAMLYENVRDTEKQRWHGAIATHLEARLRAGLGEAPLAEAPLETLSAVAHHYMEAGRSDETILYALAAGVASARLFANAAAEEFLRAGLALIRQDMVLSRTDRWRAERFAYLRTLGDVQRMAGQVKLAAESYEEAITLGDGDAAVAHPARVADLMTSLSKCYQIMGNLNTAFASAARAFAACDGLGDKVGAARALLTSCRLHHFAGHKVEAIADTERALALAQEAGDQFRIGEAYGFLGYLYTTSEPDKVGQGIAYLNQSVGILTALGDKIGLQNSYNLLGNAQIARGEFLAARETFLLTHQLSFEVGARDDEVVSNLNLSICEIELGNFVAAAAIAATAHAQGIETHSDFYTGLALVFEAAAKGYIGQFDGAQALSDQALANALEGQNKYVETLVMQYRVEMYLVQGHLALAKAAAKRLIDLIKETGNTEPEGRMTALLGEIVARQGDMTAGLDYVRVALQGAQTAQALGIKVRAQTVEAWIALQRGEWEVARRVAVEARALSRQLGTKYLTAELEGILGEVALATRSGDALDHFVVMEDLAEQMQTDLLLALAIFGQAAAIGAPDRAVPLVKRAQGLLAALMTNLDEDAQLCFGSLRERARIISGDFIGGFKARAALDIKVSMPGIKLGGGMWGM